jgi:hypothetical protein
MTTATATDKRRQLLRDGFCQFEGILDFDLLDQTRKISDALLDRQPPEHFEQQKSTGSMISVFDDPAFAELVRCPAAIAALGSLGFPHPKWWSGFVISKPPQSPPLFWHQDWWGWNHPVSYGDPVPQKVFLMYYTVDTRRDNGCLRVIPGSHLIRHRLHDAVPDAHTDALRKMEDPRSPVYQTVEEAVDVPVRAGDLVIGDSRLLHSAHTNDSAQRRTVITLWYFPAFDRLPDSIRAHVVAERKIDAWPAAARARIAHLLPEYGGGAEPIEWNRIPGPGLRDSRPSHPELEQEIRNRGNREENPVT